jgi:hypothetical protein
MNSDDGKPGEFLAELCKEAAHYPVAARDCSVRRVDGADDNGQWYIPLFDR